MPTTEIMRFAELTEHPWKNGGGITREIAGASVGGARVWRLSLADVARDGAFSVFAEYVRVLTVVQGEGMMLQHNGGSIDARPWRPVRFSGALPIDAELKSGASTNLNLMFNPDYCEGDVAVFRGPIKRLLEAHPRRLFAVHSLAGSLKLHENVRLSPGDTAIIRSDVGHLALAEGEAALLAQIDLHQGVDADAVVLGARA